ncbi:MAG: hypothetical protein Fur0032_09910 [Terrimicrobiaceae bacterium]
MMGSFMAPARARHAGEPTLRQYSFRTQEVSQYAATTTDPLEDDPIRKNTEDASSGGWEYRS